MARTDPHSYFDTDQPRTSHLEVRWNVDFESGRVSGEASLDFGQPISGRLDLDTDRLTIHEVRTAEGAAVPWHLGEPDPILGQRLRLDVAPPTRVIRIRYETSPEATALQWLSPVQTAGKRHPFLFSQCQPHHARSLAPLQDSPRARVTYGAEVTVPEALTAVMSAGPEGSRPGSSPGTKTYLFKMPQAIPTYLLALAVGNLQSRDLSGRSRVWAEPETVEAAAWEFAGIEDMIRKAEGIFGPYEWDRYDMIVLPPAFPYGGMENPRLAFLTPTLLAGDRSLVSVVAHELAHSWTGNLVTNATMNDFWLNEGFTVWAERRILEAIHGADYAAMCWAMGLTSLNHAFERFGADSPYTRLRTDLWGVDPDSVYSEVPYEKGARLIELVEQTVGRKRFEAFVMAYMDRFQFTSITTEEFAAFLDEQLPGISEKMGLKAWLHDPGLPANSPVFHSADLEAIQTLAARWPEGARPGREQVEWWRPEQLLIYLQDLPRELSPSSCAWLDETFALTGRGNYDILVEWLTIAAASNYEPAFDRIRKVLGTVGRMKYLRPLYGALGKNPRTRALARDIYAEVGGQYHALSRQVVESVMAEYPKA